MRIGILTGGGDCPGLNAVIRAVVRKGIAEGKSLEQLKAAKVLSAWDRYSWSFISTDAYLETAYKSLTAK